MYRKWQCNLCHIGLCREEVEAWWHQQASKEAHPHTLWAKGLQQSKACSSLCTRRHTHTKNKNKIKKSGCRRHTDPALPTGQTLVASLFVSLHPSIQQPGCALLLGEGGSRRSVRRGGAARRFFSLDGPPSRHFRPDSDLTTIHFFDGEIIAFLKKNTRQGVCLSALRWWETLHFDNWIFKKC